MKNVVFFLLVAILTSCSKENIESEKINVNAKTQAENIGTESSLDSVIIHVDTLNSGPIEEIDGI